MTEKELSEIKKYLKTLSGAELEEVKKAVEQEEEDQIMKDENFMFRDFIDDYFYMIYYKDGSFHYDYIGKRAYKKYMEDPNAIRIGYKTKDLFPTYGTLLVKENYERA